MEPFKNRISFSNTIFDFLDGVSFFCINIAGWIIHGNTECVSQYEFCLTRYGTCKSYIAVFKGNLTKLYA